MPPSDKDTEKRQLKLARSIGEDFRSAVDIVAQRATGNWLIITESQGEKAYDTFLGKVESASRISLGVILALVDDGYLTLTDKALAGEDELKDRAERRDLSDEPSGAESGSNFGPRGFHQGSYL